MDQVSRKESSIEIRHAGGADEFDQVIFACHSDQALNLIEQPAAIEKDILSGLSYQENDVILHCDDTLMPNRKLAWSGWNFLAGEQSAEQPPLVTYCMNILQSIKSELPLLVSLNARHKIDPEKIFKRTQILSSHLLLSSNSIPVSPKRNLWRRSVSLLWGILV